MGLARAWRRERSHHIEDALVSRRHIEVLLALERRVLRDGTLEVGPRVLVLEPLDSTLFDVLELPQTALSDGSIHSTRRYSEVYWTKYFRMFADFVIGVKQAFTACDLRRIVLPPRNLVVYARAPKTNLD